MSAPTGWATCGWPKGCIGGVFAYVSEDDNEDGYCGVHLLEWLSNLPYRDADIDVASFIVNDKYASHRRFTEREKDDED